MIRSAVCGSDVYFARSRTTGKERDTESGNDYFLARYYNSAIGRFTTPDWSAKVVPVPYAQMGDPQSLNLYAYVRNNPLIHVDVDGHEDKVAHIVEQVTAAAAKANSTSPGSHGNAALMPDHYNLNLNGWANPTNNVERGRDGGGSGKYGASRNEGLGTNTHWGADYVGTPGQNVAAVHFGEVVSIGNAYRGDPRFKMIDIQTFDSFIKSPLIGMGYVSPADGIHPGAFVVPGQTIGTMQNIQERVGTKVTPHVHIQIHLGSNHVNPETFIPNAFKMIP